MRIRGPMPMVVTASGEKAIGFLDKNGRVVAHITKAEFLKAMTHDARTCADCLKRRAV